MTRPKTDFLFCPVLYIIGTGIGDPFAVVLYGLWPDALLQLGERLFVAKLIPSRATELPVCPVDFPLKKDLEGVCLLALLGPFSGPSDLEGLSFLPAPYSVAGTRSRGCAGHRTERHAERSRQTRLSKIAMLEQG